MFARPGLSAVASTACSTLLSATDPNHVGHLGFICDDDEGDADPGQHYCYYTPSAHGLDTPLLLRCPQQSKMEHKKTKALRSHARTQEQCGQDPARPVLEAPEGAFRCPRSSPAGGSSSLPARRRGADTSRRDVTRGAG